MRVKINPVCHVNAVRVTGKLTVTKEWTDVSKKQGDALLKRERGGVPLVVEELPKKSTTD